MPSTRPNAQLLAPHTDLTPAARIQRWTMVEALLERLGCDAHTAGLMLPTPFDYVPVDDRQAQIDYGTPARDGQDRMRTAILAAPWNEDMPERIDRTALDRLVGHARRAIRADAQRTVPAETPPWAVLVHPVLLQLMLSHEPRRTMMPLGRAPSQDRDDRWDVDSTGDPEHEGVNGTVASGECMIVDGVLHVSRMGIVVGSPGRSLSCVTATCTSVGGTTLTVPGILPQTALTSVPGRRFGEVVGLPATGHVDVDEAASATVVAAVRELANGFELVFEPTTFIPYGTPPDEACARAMALAPVTG